MGRYIMTLTALIDADTDEEADKILNLLISDLSDITHLPVKGKLEKIPTTEELGEFGSKEWRKWMKKMPV